MSTPTIFISYSHKDEQWKERLVTQLKVLQMEGILDVWDDRRIEAGDDWYPEIQKAIERAAVAILLISADFLTSKFILSEEVPRLLERREKEGVRVIPLILRPCPWQKVKWLSRIQLRPKDGRPLTAGSEYQSEEELASLAEEVARSRSARPESGGVQVGPEKISLAKLPSTSPLLLGRDHELEALDRSWGHAGTNIVELVAWGGVGKTTLVGVWLNRMQQDNWRGAVRVFGWSFYSQGAAEGKQASADQFIAAALGWFGDEDPNKGSPWEKGERLAELVRRERTLLVLDGVEPLQHPPGGPLAGQLKDPGLETVLRELARNNAGLCILTTRLAVDDLKDFVGVSLDLTDLGNLSPEAGAEYLGRLGVKGTPEELPQASAELKGHALALTLLGTFLARVHGGDIRKRDLLPKLLDEKKQGAHARGVMEAYERWFKGKPELDILRMMGLFDRPAEAGAIRALREPPPIPALTEQLGGLSQAEWNEALTTLREARLLDPEDQEAPGTLDCHPLVREHFGEKLKAAASAAWKEAHGRLYEYYKSAAKEFPDTIEEMAPLFAAVTHGCHAGRHQEALDDVYWRRIERKAESFSTAKLGAFGADLAALAGFFDSASQKPVAGLTESDKAFVLNTAGFDLRALGRLAEAAPTTMAGLAAHAARSDWQNAAIAAGNLSELHLSLGNIGQAISYAQQSVEFADRSGDAIQRFLRRPTLAAALHQAGHMDEAEEIFQEAERMQKEQVHECPSLYSLRGFQYCDLLLAQGKRREVRERANKTSAWVTRTGRLLDIALDRLSLGRACQEEAHLDEAVTGLRGAGAQQFIPLGLLARAELYRVKGDFEKAQRDLDEAFRIATRSGMRLHETDCHLEQARLALAQGDRERAAQHTAAARKLIQDTGYHRRDGELAELERQLEDQAPDA